MKLKRSDIIVITTGTQALNLKHSGWIFQVLPFWLKQSSLKRSFFSLISFNICLNLSLDVLGAFFVWEIVLSHSFGLPWLKTAVKTPWQRPFKWGIIHLALKNFTHDTLYAFYLSIYSLSVINMKWKPNTMPASLVFSVQWIYKRRISLISSWEMEADQIEIVFLVDRRRSNLFGRL